MKHLLSPLLVLALFHPCGADLTLRNAVPRKFSVSCTTPTGAVKTANLGACASGLGGGTVDFPGAIKDCTVNLLDDQGQTVWTGTVPDEACLLVSEQAGKVEVRQAGWASIVNADPPKAFTFVNLTGQELKLDLNRQDGAPGLKDFALPTAPDFGKVVPAPAGERAFPTVIKDASGSVLNPAAGSCFPGTVRVFFKNAAGVIAQDQAGVLRPRK